MELERPSPMKLTFFTGFSSAASFAAPPSPAIAPALRPHLNKNNTGLAQPRNMYQMGPIAVNTNTL